MKTKNFVKFEGTKEELINYAFELLMQKAKEQPFCKHTITIPLEDGGGIEMYVNPLSQQVYYA